MNVLQVTKGALMGGGERHVLTLLEGFSKADIKVFLVVFTEGRLAEAARRLGIPVYVFRKRFRGDIWPLFRLIRLIRRHRIDIVHTHLVSGNLYGRLAGKIAGVKGIVTTLHHSHKDAMGHFILPFMQALFFQGDIRMGALSDRLITPSDNLKEQLVDGSHINPAKLVTIPNAINMADTRIDTATVTACRTSLAIASGESVIGMVGRLVSVKNFDIFIKAARLVIDRGMTARFLIIGEGPLRTELETMTKTLNVADCFIFTGFRNDVFPLVAMMDLFVLCSASETNPIALMEAMAIGRPVVATDVGGVAELIDHGTDGWLCPANDANALADAICHLLAHPDHALTMGQKARDKIARHYALEPITDRLMTLYREIAETP